VHGRPDAGRQDREEKEVRDLEGKVAVITGGASGIGFAVAEALAAKGARVALADVEADALETAVATLAANGAKEVTGIRTDVSELESVQALRAAVESELGPVDLLFNNAGVGAGGLCWAVEHSSWRWVLGVNLWGVIHGIEVFVPGMVERGTGHIVNTASLAGLLATPGMAPYTASKHAVVGISETLLRDLETVGSSVRVSVLCPGMVRTRIAESARNRPESLAREVEDPMESIIGPIFRALVDKGTEPAQIASEVVTAIEEERFWILPHRDRFAKAIESRFASAVREEPPPPTMIT
jgi:NAD(P)-dependent dehydrogenase (short-subunit alcohol dehydrogenase family)